MESVTIRVPATTGNLAAGFDTLGCALSLYNTLTFKKSETLSFSGCDAAYQNADNLAVQAFSAVYRHVGKKMPPVHIDFDTGIPVSRGLGSSAALLAAGAMAANAMSGAELPLDVLLALTTGIEGHPDNLAPAFYGGLTASLMEGNRVFSVSYSVHPNLHFVTLSPDFPLSTHAAREVLPQRVPHGDAVYNCAHLAVLIKALELGDEELIAAALRDRLHQPYRETLIAEYADVSALARQNGCNAVCISGAGPTVLCVTADTAFADRMRRAVQSLRHTWQVRDLTVDQAGARLL